MNTTEQHEAELENHDFPQDDVAQAESVDESRRHFSKSSLAVSGVLLTLASRAALGGGMGGGGGGGGGGCKSPSGFVSGNVSQHGKTPPGGHSCEYWISHCDSWVNCDRSKDFCTEFNFNDDNSSSHGCKIRYNFSRTSTKYTKDSTNSTRVRYTNLDILCRYHAGHKPTGSNSDCDVVKDRYGNRVNKFYTSGRCGDITSYRKIDTNTVQDQLAQHCVAALLNCRAGLTPFCPESTVKEMYNSCRTKGYFNPTAGVRWNASQCIEYIQSTWECA